MILTSTSKTVPFTPAWLAGRPDAPKFHLRAGGVIERADLEAELAGLHRAGEVFGFELSAAMRTGVETLLAGSDDVGQLLELIDRDAVLQPGEKLTDDEARILGEVRKILEQHWPDYRDLLAQVHRRRKIAPMLAFKRFCVGWEGAKSDAGVSVAFATGTDGLVTDEAMAMLSPFELSAAGSHAFNLLYPKGQVGNSPQPSSSDVGQATSNSDGMSKAVGSSAKKPGPKTPGSRSRRGSGRSSTSGS